jgi:GWxTD domain-containing protein
MKIIIFSLLLSVVSLFSFQAIADKPRAYFAWNSFFLPGSGPYIETYLQFDASSLKFVPVSNGSFSATVEILIIFKHEETIREFLKYELHSPSIDDTLQNRFSFIDQQRFLLNDGEYTIEITLTDPNSAADALIHSEVVSIGFERDTITMSSLQLAERVEPAGDASPFAKSGYNIIPFIDYFYPSNINNINFYTEIYDAAGVLGDNEAFLIVSSIEAFETRATMPEYNRFKRESARPVNVFIGSFDISRLPSGNYFLVVKAVDRNNKTLASNRVFFQRSNPELRLTADVFQHVGIENSFVESIVHPDSLSYFVRALGPISTQVEREFAENLVASLHISNMQRYFYNFWLTRNPASPEQAWRNYYVEMSRADVFFKTRISRGYATDRGRVYLQYGPPNSISKSYDEPSAYPYEIWHYYAINGQRNKRFVFYSRDFATNDFELIHSDVVGELANYRWHLMLHERKTRGWDVDSEFAPDHWGGRSRDIFLEPR